MFETTVKVADIFQKYDNPIAEIVQNACTFESEIHAKANGKRVNLKSIMGIMAFEWTVGMDVDIEAEGDDAKAAVQKICDYLMCK